MQLGEVIRKERERKNLSVEQVASGLHLTVKEFEDIEGGASPAEQWGPRLAQIAIKLETPTSRLISRNGKSDQAAQEQGQCGRLIRAKREAKGLSPEDFARLVAISAEDVAQLEEGTSPLETYGPLFLRFAELINQPVFNLFYPCGIPFQQLDDYQ
jgi:transcriptional regulator with XRE-family HTH domain